MRSGASCFAGFPDPYVEREFVAMEGVAVLRSRTSDSARGPNHARSDRPQQHRLNRLRCRRTEARKAAVGSCPPISAWPGPGSVARTASEIDLGDSARSLENH